MADDAAILTAWRRDDDQRGHSVARVDAVDGGWRCHGVEVVAGPDVVFGCRFTVTLDTRWHTRQVSVEVVAHEVRAVELTCDGEGRWTRDGVGAPDLAGCVDVDVAATPLTNTFPLRRLGHLPVGRR